MSSSRNTSTPASLCVEGGGGQGLHSSRVLNTPPYLHVEEGGAGVGWEHVIPYSVLFPTLPAATAAVPEVQEVLELELARLDDVVERPVALPAHQVFMPAAAAAAAAGLYACTRSGSSNMARARALAPAVGGGL